MTLDDLLLRIGIDRKYGKILSTKQRYLRTNNREYRQLEFRSAALLCGSLIVLLGGLIILSQIDGLLCFSVIIPTVWMFAAGCSAANKMTWIAHNTPDDCYEVVL